MSRYNFLYCFDNNYNQQAYTSMISLLDNITEKINIYVIHQNKSTSIDFPKKINTHKNLNNLYIYEFNEDYCDYPNIDGSHVSEATYYRIFIQNYVKDNIDFLIYLDADTVCVNNPILDLEKTISKLIDSNLLISAKTEILKSSINNYESHYKFEEVIPFERLNIEEAYFNAGILIINYKLWKEQNISQKLFKKMNELGNKIIAWDQDVLNSYFDGSYIELESSLNIFDTDIKSRIIPNNVSIIHYVGSKKPWKTSGVFTYASNYYHSNYRKLNSENFHIIHSWKLNSIKDLFKNLFNLKLFKLNNPFIYILEFTISIFKNNKKIYNEN